MMRRSVNLLFIPVLLRIMPVVAQSYSVTGTIEQNEPCVEGNGQVIEPILTSLTPLGNSELEIVKDDSSNWRKINFYYDDIAVIFHQPMFTSFDSVVIVKKFRTTKSGKFKLSLPAGKYFFVYQRRALIRLQVITDISNLIITYPKYPPCPDTNQYR